MSLRSWSAHPASRATATFGGAHVACHEADAIGEWMIEDAIVLAPRHQSG